MQVYRAPTEAGLASEAPRAFALLCDGAAYAESGDPADHGLRKALGFTNYVGRARNGTLTHAFRGDAREGRIPLYTTNLA